MVLKDGYRFEKSKRKHKKYDVFKGDKYLTSFGDERYQHYKDKIGLFKHLDHNDEKRRKSYRLRHKPESAEFESAGWFAGKYLW